MWVERKFNTRLLLRSLYLCRSAAGFTLTPAVSLLAVRKTSKNFVTYVTLFSVICEWTTCEEPTVKESNVTCHCQRKFRVAVWLSRSNWKGLSAPRWYRSHSHIRSADLRDYREPKTALRFWLLLKLVRSDLQVCRCFVPLMFVFWKACHECRCLFINRPQRFRKAEHFCVQMVIFVLVKDLRCRIAASITIEKDWFLASWTRNTDRQKFSGYPITRIMAVNKECPYAAKLNAIGGNGSALMVCEIEKQM